jgi:phosphinothricin acetyltransferase
MIRSLSPPDWPAVRAIYEEGIATGHATFQAEAPTWEQWDAGHLPVCRLVFVGAGAIAGWAALSQVSSRRVYAGVAEVSIYVAANQRGAGVGSQLLEALVAESERQGIWTLQAGVFPENIASVALHARCGFRVVGRREHLGQMNGRWRDVLLLERRSASVGLQDQPEIPRSPPDVPLVNAMSRPAMNAIFHITTSEQVGAAAQAGFYVPEAFAVEGFIHCSYARQIRDVANRRFVGRSGLALLEIDRERVCCDVLDENLEGGTELFPHIYGCLPMAAVLRVHPFPCGPDGRFELPESVR